uniref:Uncharacterized protein n=1 Tax=Leersia perrieri TaxID=77586 RepID=A0A0D9W6W1_9ORYZ
MTSNNEDGNDNGGSGDNDNGGNGRRGDGSGDRMHLVSPSATTCPKGIAFKGTTSKGGCDPCGVNMGP